MIGKSIEIFFGAICYAIKLIGDWLNDNEPPVTGLKF